MTLNPKKNLNSAFKPKAFDLLSFTYFGYLRLLATLYYLLLTVPLSFLTSLDLLATFSLPLHYLFVTFSTYS